jgi:Zn-finger nucleic acid-binding protein
MKCPLDATELLTRTYEAGIQVDLCPTCRGIFLDHGELERIQDSSERDHAALLAQVPDTVSMAFEKARQEERPDLVCPKCGGQMGKQEHGHCSQILVDVCASCHGVWLDRGELQALELFFEQAQADSIDMWTSFTAGLSDVVSGD